MIRPGSKSLAAPAPTMHDLNNLYSQIFAAHLDAVGSELRHELCSLLGCIMAAQEPLPQSLLEQMGLSHVLRHLPGFGVLFFVAGHHLHTLHKSLSDWLLTQPFINVQQAHLQLGQHLAQQDLSQPTPYTLKYLVTHLVLADHADGYSWLDQVLQQFDFIEAVYRSGHEPRLLADLSRLPVGATMPGKELQRCLAAYGEDVIFDYRLQDSNIMLVALQRMMLQCPIKSKLFRMAEANTSEQRGGWRTLDAWGHHYWPACLSKVRFVLLRSIEFIKIPRMLRACHVVMGA